MDRAELDRCLDEIAARLPAMRERYEGRDDVLAELAGELDLIEDAAVGASDAAHGARRVDSILAAAGCLVD
jgi:hypothetical protein